MTVSICNGVMLRPRRKTRYCFLLNSVLCIEFMYSSSRSTEAGQLSNVNDVGLPYSQDVEIIGFVSVPLVDRAHGHDT